MALVSKKITGLQSGTSYDASVTARGDGETWADSDESVLFNFNTLNKLATPTDFGIDESNGIQNKSTTAITFRWQTSESNNVYQLSYQVGNEPEQTTEINSYQTKTIDNQLYGYYELSNLSPGTNYSVKLKQLATSEQEEESDYTDAVSATTKQPLVIAAPSNFDMRDTKLIVRWNNNAYAVSYVCNARLNGDIVETLQVSESPAEFTQLVEGNTYTFGLQAIADPNSNEYVDSLEAISDAVLYDVSNLPAPETFEVVDATSDSITLQWTGVDGATGYSLMFREVGGEYEPLSNFQVSDNVYTRQVVNLEPGVEYEFQLIALGDGDTTQNSLPTVISYSTLAAQLPVVIGFDYSYEMEGNARVFHTTCTSIKWKWEMGTFSSDSQALSRRYEIEIRPTNGSSTFLEAVDYTIRSNPTTNYYFGYFTTDNLVQGTEYQARIRSLATNDTEITSDWSPWKTCNTREPLDSPSNTAFLMRLSDLKISWDATPNATSYRAIAKNLQGELIETVTPTVPAAVFTGLTLGETYNFELYSVPARTNNLYSESDALTIENVVYEVEHLPLPEIYRYDSTENSITVEWSEVPHADSYTLKYRKANTGNFINVANYSQYPNGDKAGLYYATLGSLDPQTNYEIQIQAIGDGDSYLDSEVGTLNATTGRTPAVQLTTPSDFGIQAKDEDGLDADYLSYDFVRLMWSPIQNAVGYRVRYKKSSEDNWEESITSYSVYAVGFNIDKCYLEIHSLESLTSYTFDIIAIGDNVDYLNSTETTITATTDRAPAVKLATPEIVNVGKAAKHIGISWRADEHAVGSRLRYRKSSEQTWTDVREYSWSAEDKICSASIDSLEENTEYVIELTSVGDSLNYTDSDTVTLTVKTNRLQHALKTPSDFALESTTAESAVVNWTPIDDASGYKIRYRPINTVLWETVESSTFPVYSSGDNSGKAYATLQNTQASSSEFEFTIIAVGDGVDFLNSPETKITGYFAQKLLPPEIFQVRTVTESSAVVEWSSSANATDYQLRYRTGSGAWKSLTNHYRERATIDWYNIIPNLRANTTYECELIALGNGTNLISSDPKQLSFSTLIDSNLTPTTLTATIVNGGFYCQWEPVDGANSYVLAYFDTQNDESSIVESIRINGSETYWQTNILTADPDGQGYLAIYPSVLPTNGTGNERKPWSNFVQVRDVGSVYELLPPRNVNVVGTTMSVISLEWEPVLAATSYVVKCGTKEVVTQSAFADITGLLADTDYEIQVKSRSNYSFFARNESDYGAPITARTAQRVLEKLEAPNIRLVSKTDSAITVNWEFVEHASGYKLFYNVAGSGNPATKIESYETVGNKAQVTITGLSAATNYIIEALAVGDAYDYQDSDRSRLTVKTDSAPLIPLDTPSGLVCVDKTKDTISLEWNGVANASGYIVSYGSHTISVTNPAAVLPNLAHGRTYSIKVKAVGDGSVYGDSPYTAAIRVETDSDPIPEGERKTALNYIRTGRLVSIKPTEVIPKGTAIKQGAVVGVINHTRNDSDAFGSLELDGIYNVPLASGASFALGDLVCLDEDGNAAASGMKFGYAIEATNSKSRRVKTLLVPWLDTLK